MAKSRTQTISKLVWLDLEMTGLDLDKDVIMEISILITTPDLEIVDENGFTGVARITKEQSENMDPYAHEFHKENGLLEESLNSENSESKVEEMALGYLKKYVDRKEAPLCGNSIATDRAFIMKRLPKIENHIHHRNIDTYTLRQLININKPDIAWVEKEPTHRSLDDIRNSIEEMKYYVDLLFTD